MSSPDVDAPSVNREVWTKSNADYTDRSAPAQWATDEMDWGQYGVPESELRVFADIDLDGSDVIELGCGTAYFSAWLAKRGARPTGVDVTPAQLETARRMQRETGIEFPLIEANAEEVPLPDGSFDLVVSEYGASIWCDPYRWIPEAARLLRPGGHLVFLRNSTLVALCSPDEGMVDERLVRPMFGMYRFDWRHEGGGIEYHVPHAELIKLLRANRFEILDLWELQAPDTAKTHEYYDYVSAEWARKWPVEEIWKARLA